MDELVEEVVAKGFPLPDKNEQEDQSKAIQALSSEVKDLSTEVKDLKAEGRIRRLQDSYRF